MNILKRMLAIAFIALFAIAIMEGFASAQCANGQCSSRNANLGESVSQLPAPIPVPTPQPQIAYYTAPQAGGGAYASSYAGTAPPPQTGALYVAGYAAPPQPQIGYVVTQPIPVAGVNVGVGTFAGTSVGVNVGASTNLAGGGCSNGGCSRGGFFSRIRAPRQRSFSRSVSVSRSG
jgi:hypothetical protein